MRILIAEDEPEILKPYQIALEARKHQVVTSESGEECLKIYLDETSKSQHDEMTSTDVVRGASNSSSLFSSPFDVVILDYRLPKKNGMEVAREILETNPDQRIIFASAYVKDTLEDSVRQLKKVVELLQKPFEPDVLVETVELLKLPVTTQPYLLILKIFFNGMPEGANIVTKLHVKEHHSKVDYI